MITADQNKLNRDVQVWGWHVERYAEQLNMDMAEAIKLQAGYLMRDLADDVSPVSKKRLENAIENDVKSVFAPFDKFQKTVFRGKKPTGGEVVWIGATRKTLTGIKGANVRMGIDAGAMSSIFKTRRGKMGKRYEHSGFTGKRAVRMLNRIAVKQSAFNRFVKIQLAKAGKLKASFALGWEALRVKGRKPAGWITRHIRDKTAKGSFVDATKIKESPSVTIVSNQLGCSNPRTIAIIRRLLGVRLHSMRAHTETILRKRK